MPRKRATKTEGGGGTYRALAGLSWPADPAVLRRIYAGEKLSPEERGETIRVEAGKIAHGLPEPSVGWLLEEGLIEFADEVDQRDPAGLPSGDRRTVDHPTGPSESEEGSSDG